MKVRLALLGIALGAVTAASTPNALAQTPPPLSATAVPTPSGALVRYAGQILDMRGGFVFFTSGDGFALDPQYRTIDAVSGAQTTLVPATGLYARAAFDPQSGHVIELALSRKPLPQAAAYGDVQRFVVSASSPYPNPDLAQKPTAQGGGGPYTGRRVLVQFTVEVPPTTPLTEDLYMTTDQSLWEPTAIKFTRIDALHYRVSDQFASGTKLLYLYTRGSWRSVERGEDGLERKPRVFIVGENDTQSHSDVVYHWADETQGGAPAAGPDSIPTPFNPRPFATPH